MSYRRDIDGLRAIAVLAVILFHFGFVSGGFVGVDIFFVISGYLITGIIDEEVNSGSFRITHFYLRRIRRIFPALFVLYFAVLALTVLFAFSTDAGDVGKSVQSSVFFVSNIFFYNGSGYFEDRNALRPLLHTWSLSVEEQFYIILPFLVFLLGRFALKVRYAVLWAIALASLAASAWMVRKDAAAAFYLMQFRAWEFLAGSLLAVGAVPAIRRADVAEWLGGLGLLLTVASAAVMSRAVVFPGLAALPPCLGAALIIHSGRHHVTQVSRVLSLPALVFTGLISYSLYLWHWPLLVFCRYVVENPSRPEKLLLIAASFGLATLSWRYVETPFRKLRLQDRRTPVFAAAAAAMVLTALIAMPLEPLVRTLWAEPARITRTLRYVNYHRSEDKQRSACFISSGSGGSEMFDKSLCLALSDQKPNVLIIGDSHAAHLWAGLSGTFPNVNFLQATASGCRPVARTGGKSRCVEIRDFVFDTFLPQHRLDGIILASRWREHNLDALKATVGRLSSLVGRVIVLGPIVEYKMALPRILAKSIHAGDPALPGRYRSLHVKALDARMAAGLKDTPAEFISLWDRICAPECAVWAGDGVPLQFDYGHLTSEGSFEIARRIGSQLFPGQKLTLTGGPAAAAPE